MFIRSKPAKFSSCCLFTDSSIEEGRCFGAVGMTTDAISSFVGRFVACTYNAAVKNSREPTQRQRQLSGRQAWRG